MQIEGNRVLRAPSVASFRPQAKGISLTGGIQGARGNRVTCITLAGNLVAGVRNDVSALANAPDASENAATVGGC